jgi:hypothetical protein
VTITDIHPISVQASDGLIRVSIEPDSGIISTVRNQLILLDSDDSTAISLTVRFR